MLKIWFSDLSNAQRRLSQTLTNFKFECIGNNQTEDEMVIANSLREFGKLIAAIGKFNKLFLEGSGRD